jgi:hypothetical protein
MIAGPSMIWIATPGHAVALSLCVTTSNLLRSVENPGAVFVLAAMSDIADRAGTTLVASEREVEKTLGPRAGIGLVAGAGETPAFSAPNLMSGLRKVGGGSALGVVAVLAGAVLGAGSACLTLQDRSCLPEPERQARSAGRGGAVAGGTVGAAGVVYSVGALGVPGFSAAGISSGLSALGAPLGGGMVAGVTVSVLAAVAAALFYMLIRWFRAGSERGPAPSAA